MMGAKRPGKRQEAGKETLFDIALSIDPPTAAAATSRMWAEVDWNDVSIRGFSPTFCRVVPQDAAGMDSGNVDWSKGVELIAPDGTTVGTLLDTLQGAYDRNEALAFLVVSKPQREAGG